MGVETLVVALVVAGAVGFVGNRIYQTVRAARRRNDDGGCAGGCCSTEH